MAEDSLHSSPYRLRLLFVVLLSHCQVINPSELFELHWEKMAYFWRRGRTDDEARRICLEWIRRRVRVNYGNVDDPLFDGVPHDQHVPGEGDEVKPSDLKRKAQGEFHCYQSTASGYL